jgi:transcriptional regulator with XRE-family HTH domain
MPAMSVLNKSGFDGQRLQLAREFCDLTQKQLGEKVAASHALVSLCESGKRTEPATDLVEAFGTVLGFETDFFYQPTGEIFREGECSFRHRRSTPERLKTKIRAHASLLGMVLERLRAYLKFPALNIPRISASTDEEIEKAAEQTRLHWALGTEAPISEIGRVTEHAGVFLVSHLAESSQVDAFFTRWFDGPNFSQPQCAEHVTLDFRRWPRMRAFGHAFRNTNWNGRNGGRDRPICRRIPTAERCVRAGI